MLKVLVFVPIPIRIACSDRVIVSERNLFQSFLGRRRRHHYLEGLARDRVIPLGDQRRRESPTVTEVYAFPL